MIASPAFNRTSNLSSHIFWNHNRTSISNALENKHIYVGIRKPEFNTLLNTEWASALWSMQLHSYKHKDTRSMFYLACHAKCWSSTQGRDQNQGSKSSASERYLGYSRSLSAKQTNKHSTTPPTHAILLSQTKVPHVLLELVILVYLTHTKHRSHDDSFCTGPPEGAVPFCRDVAGEAPFSPLTGWNRQQLLYQETVLYGN